MIYKCFGQFFFALQRAVRLDQVLLSADKINDPSKDTENFGTSFLMKAVESESRKGPIRLFTVPLLLKMLELFSSQSAATSNTNVFLGAVYSDDVETMSLIDGRAAAWNFRDILIHLDEVPMWVKSNNRPFFNCLLLRNIIRCMGLPCLLSGTESTLLNVVEYGSGSRRTGGETWAWLLTKFPATELSEQLTELTGSCDDYEKHLLKNTRPLFIQWFADCHNNGLTKTTEGRISMTEKTLVGMKYRMVMAKHFMSDDESVLNDWLHASTLLVFTDSLLGGGKVNSTVTSLDSTNRKRQTTDRTRPAKRQKIADDVRYHSLVIRKHYALLFIPPQADMTNGMTKLRVDSTLGLGISLSSGEPFKVRAAFKTCAVDPLLYLAGLHGGIMRHPNKEDLLTMHSTEDLVPVPSSYAFRTFNIQSGVGNRLAKSNDGTGLEAECIAALVLAAHRYESFNGTQFFDWLALVVSELSEQMKFIVTEITTIPKELKAALKNVMVPLLSPPNSPWGEDIRSGINFGNFSWCKNLERRDPSAPLRNIRQGRTRTRGRTWSTTSGSSRSSMGTTATLHSERSLKIGRVLGGKT